MAGKLTTNFKDVNGIGAKTSFWCNDAITAALANQALANLSNAQIVSSFITKDRDLGAFTIKSNALAANNESVRTKVLIRMSGADSGSVANPRATALLFIPAPIGTLINGPEGDPTNALVTVFVGKIQTANDVAIDQIDKVIYVK
jgi:hypothetical protein